MHRGEADRLVGARQDVPLVVGLGDGEIVPRQRRRGDPRPHRPGRSSSRRATSPTCARDGVVDHRCRRAPPRAPGRRSIDWSPEAAEKGGYEHFMLKEIHEQPEALAPVDRRPGRPRGPDPGERARRPRRDDPGVDPGRAGGLRQRLLRRARRRGRDRGLDRPARAGHGRLRVPLRPAAARRAARSSSPSPSRARPPTRSPRPGSPASAAARSSR